jgi:hypothetical protein
VSFVAIAIAGSALIGAGTSIYESNKAQDAAQSALTQQQQLAAGLTYQPIDIASLESQATEASIANATNSLALQKQLQPGVYQANQELQQSVASQLAMGGNLPPDIANQVTQAARTAGGSSGNQGNNAPATAALLGTSALSLLQQRQQAAASLAAANPAPQVGLDPGSLASAVVANSNAANQFNLAKAGIGSNLINSQAQVTSAGAGAQAGQINSLTSLLGQLALYQSKTGTGANTPALQAGNAALPTAAQTSALVAPANGSIIGGIN